MREVVSFDASTSFDPDLEQPIASYSWNFGGSRVFETDPFTTFQFAGPGDYAVSLLVRSTPDNPQEGEQTQIVHVTAEAPPRARLTADNTTPLAGQLVTFDASQSRDAAATSRGTSSTSTATACTRSRRPSRPRRTGTSAEGRSGRA